MRVSKSFVLLIAVFALCSYCTAKSHLKFNRLSLNTKLKGIATKLYHRHRRVHNHAATTDSSGGRSIRILLLRHGEAENNIVEHSYMKRVNTTSYDIEGTFRYKRRNSELIFSGLTARGEDQALQAGRVLREAYPNVKYVFISPLLRTVQTTSLAMRGYPVDVQYFLLPWLKERIGLQADIGYNAYEAIKAYPFIDARIIKDKPFWFLDYWDEEHDDQGLGKQMRAVVAENPSIDALLDFFVMKHINHAENPLQVRYRKDRALQEVREFVRSQENKGVPVGDDEILLVSHYSILMAVLNDSNSEGNPGLARTIKPIANCEIRTFLLDL